MKYLLAFILTGILSQSTPAQKMNDVSGVYYLTGVMETASGFQLKPDSTFEFYYTYGALDRYGLGNWELKNNIITLNSKPYPGNDFRLIDSSKNRQDKTIIQVAEKNKNFYQFVYCLVKIAGADSLLNADSDGRIVIPGDAAGTVQLLFELCPDKVSTFTIDRVTHNTYTFDFEPWIAEVFFKDFNLRFITNHLEGSHPLLENKIYQYIKE